MSKKKLFNLIELIIILVLFAVIFFLPYVEIIVDKGVMLWPTDAVILPVGKYTYFQYAMQGVGDTYYLIMLALNAIMCLFSIILKTQKKDSLVHPLLSVIILLWAMPDYNNPWAEGPREAITLEPCCTLSLILLAIIVVLSFLKRSNLVFPKSDAPVVVEKKASASKADELKKYKELLDSGVITQEEFDAKKKQLLNL